MPTSASELLTKSTSVPVGASSMMVVWKVEEVKTGTLSFTSFTRTVTVPVPLRDGEPGDEGRKAKELWMTIAVSFRELTKKKWRRNCLHIQNRNNSFHFHHMTDLLLVPRQAGKGDTVTCDMSSRLTLDAWWLIVHDLSFAARSTLNWFMLLWRLSHNIPAAFNSSTFLWPSFWVSIRRRAATSTHTSTEHIKRVQCLWNQIFQASFLGSWTLIDLISTARYLF